MRFICESKTDQELNGLYLQSEEMTKSLTERKKWLIEQVKALNKEESDSSLRLWTKIEKRLSDLGHLNEYNSENEYISLNRETGQIFIKKKEEESELKKILAGLLK